MKPVNLNQFRKSKAREEKRATADANAIKFGASKANKDLEKSRDALAKTRLDGHKRDDE